MPLCHLVILTLLAAPPAATLRPLEGEPLTGPLTAITATSVQMQTPAGSQDLPTSQVMWLEFPARSLAEKPSVWLELIDGSRLLASSYSAAQGKSQATLLTGQALELPTRSIHTVRFNAALPELAVQWREITSSMASADSLVVRKTSMRTVEQGENEPRTVTEQALDQVEGTVVEVRPDVVVFELDGEKVNVRREKLEGIVYYQPNRRPLAAAVCRLIDAGGSQWQVKNLELAGDQLSVATLGGQAFHVSLLDVAKIDFSIGNIAFLTELEPEPVAESGAPSLQPSAMSTKFSRIFQRRSSAPLGGDGFRMGTQRYASGMSLHSPTKLVYRIPSGFKKFFAVAGIDNSILAPGRFSLVVLADGKEVVRQEFSEQQRQPLPLTLDVSNVRRLTIQLEPGEGLDIGDQLNLCEARFTK